MMPYASTMLFGYFEIVLDDKIKFPNKFYVNNFTRKMATLAKSGNFTSKNPGKLEKFKFMNAPLVNPMTKFKLSFIA